MSGRDRIWGDGLSYTYVTRAGETLGTQGSRPCGPRWRILQHRRAERLRQVHAARDHFRTAAADRRQVLLDGERLSGPDRRVGILLQKDHLFEWRTVLENAELGLEIHGTGPMKPGVTRSSFSRHMASAVSSSRIHISFQAACASALR